MKIPLKIPKPALDCAICYSPNLRMLSVMCAEAATWKSGPMKIRPPALIVAQNGKDPTKTPHA